jgi:hypothetical protein
MMRRPRNNRKLAKCTRAVLRSLNVVPHFGEVKPQSIVQLDHSLHFIQPDKFPMLRVSGWFGFHRLNRYPVTSSQAQPVPLVYTYVRRLLRG